MKSVTIRPSINPALLLSPVDGGYVAYDPQTDRLHRLNPLAALMLELCDGSRTVGEIRDAVSPMLPEDREAEVDHWIRRAEESGLVTLTVAHTSLVKQLSSEELARLADRLHEQGKLQTALICQQRAAELSPENAAILYHLGELAHIVGNRDLARDAYDRYLDLEPDDAEVGHLMTALSDKQSPARVPNECIEQLYARFSSFYDANVYEELGSQAPSRLAEVIDSVTKKRPSLSVLDLGCGTGVSGEHLKSRASRLVGVDLSVEMVEIARERMIYDELEVAEITEWLQQSEERFDVIVACDSLIYFGDLTQVIAPAAGLLREGGIIAFSVERSVGPPYHLMDSGRYVHHVDHIDDVARDVGLKVQCQIEDFLRMEYGEEVTGLFIAMASTAA